MNILDNENNLIAIYINKDIPENKHFLTDDSKPFQVGTFNLPKGNIIERHYHNSTIRNIEHTSEALFVTEGSLRVELYDKNQTFLKEILVNEKEVIVLFTGGHFIEIIENSKFIEIKQGPYSEAEDKEHF